MKNRKNILTIIKTSTYMILFLLLISSIYKYNKYTDDLFYLKYLEIKGNDYISTDEIADLISVNRKKSIFDYDIKNIKNTLEKIPFVKTVHIGLKIPDKLEIQITERVPIALILHNKTKFFIDNTIIVADFNSLNHFPVPILNIKNKNINSNNSMHIIKYLYKNYNSMYSNVSEILELNSKITLITDNKTKIFINPNMAINNIQKLIDFEQSIELVKNINNYKYIDLIYKNQIVVKEKV